MRQISIVQLVLSVAVVRCNYFIHNDTAVIDDHGPFIQTTPSYTTHQSVIESPQLSNDQYARIYGRRKKLASRAHRHERYQTLKTFTDSSISFTRSFCSKFNTFSSKGSHTLIKTVSGFNVQVHVSCSFGLESIVTTFSAIEN